MEKTILALEIYKEFLQLFFVDCEYYETFEYHIATSYNETNELIKMLKAFDEFESMNNHSVTYTIKRKSSRESNVVLLNKPIRF